MSEQESILPPFLRSHKFALQNPRDVLNVIPLLQRSVILQEDIQKDILYPSSNFPYHERQRHLRNICYAQSVLRTAFAYIVLLPRHLSIKCAFLELEKAACGMNGYMQDLETDMRFHSRIDRAVPRPGQYIVLATAEAASTMFQREAGTRIYQMERRVLQIRVTGYINLRIYIRNNGFFRLTVINAGRREASISGLHVGGHEIETRVILLPRPSRLPWLFGRSPRFCVSVPIRKRISWVSFFVM